MLIWKHLISIKNGYVAEFLWNRKNEYKGTNDFKIYLKYISFVIINVFAVLVIN